MKHIFILFVPLFFCYLHSFAQNNNKACNNFKKGNYIYKESPFDKTKIKRTKHNQYEIDPSDTTYLKYKIEWVSSCRYVLTYVKVNKPKYRFLLGKKIFVTIDNIIDDNTYTYYAVLMGDTTRATIIRQR